MVLYCLDSALEFNLKISSQAGMKRYLFFVNQPYAYAILRPLQDEIWRRGDEAAWFVAGCTDAPLAPEENQLKTVSEVMSYDAHATLVPGDWVPHFFPGIKVEVFHGLARNKRGHSSEEESDHYKIRGWFDLYCTHAENDTEKFQKLAQKHGSFAVVKTGWPKLDPILASGRRGKRKDEEGGAPVVFYASTFSRSVTSAPYLADVIEKLAESGRWRFIVTLHPKMDPEIVARYRNMSGRNLKFVEAERDLLPELLEADVMLCDTSSIMFEFMFLDRPVVTYKTKMPGPYLIDIQRQDDIERGLEQAITRPRELMLAAETLCERLNQYRDGRSSMRILNAIDEVLHSERKLKPKPLNLIRKWKVRRRLQRELAKRIG